MAITEDIVARANADLQRALATAARARETLAQAEAEVSDLDAFLRTLRRYVAPAESADDNIIDREHRRNNVRTVPAAGSRARELVDAAISAIRKAGKPLMIGDLLDAVNAAGFTLGGSDHKSNLAGYLSRDPRVESRGRNVGWVVLEDEGAALEPASGEAAPSSDQGGTNDRSTLADPGEAAGLLD